MDKMKELERQDVDIIDIKVRTMEWERGDTFLLKTDMIINNNGQPRYADGQVISILGRLYLKETDSDNPVVFVVEKVSKQDPFYRIKSRGGWWAEDICAKCDHNGIPYR